MTELFYVLYFVGPVLYPIALVALVVFLIRFLRQKQGNRTLKIIIIIGLILLLLFSSMVSSKSGKRPDGKENRQASAQVNLKLLNT